MIAIVDYGMGNLRSVSKAFEAVGHQAVVTRDPVDRSGMPVMSCCPVSGPLAIAWRTWNDSTWLNRFDPRFNRASRFLGICLGLQLLFTESEEFGVHKGLSIIPGKVRRFARDPALKIPHMGWNQVHVQRALSAVRGYPERLQLVLCAFLFRRSGRPSRGGHHDDLRRSVCVEYLEGQYRRLPVPSGKEPIGRFAVDQEFWSMAWIAHRRSWDGRGDEGVPQRDVVLPDAPRSHTGDACVGLGCSGSKVTTQTSKRVASLSDSDHRA